MNSSIYHGCKDPNLKEREKYLDLQLDFSEFLQEAQYQEETNNLLQNNANTSNPKFATKKKSWIKYFSLFLRFQSKFTKKSKTSSQRKSKHGAILGPATGVACKLASIREVIRKAASKPLVGCFHPIKEEIEVPYVRLEKLGCYALRREAFGPIYLVT